MPTPEQFLDATPLATLLKIPGEALDYFAATAYQLYQDGRYSEAETVCRGLVAADHRSWYSNSLLAATLQKMGRFKEAVAQVDLGLKYEPDQPKLVALRAEILLSAERVGRKVAQVAAAKADAASAAPATGQMA